MPKKSKEEAAKTRRQIMVSALDVFHEKGYSSSSLEEIVTRIGMTRGAAYVHFKNKQDLLLQLVRELEGEMEAPITKKAMKVKSLEDLKGFWMDYLDFILGDDSYKKYLGVLTLKIEWKDDLLEIVQLFKRQSDELKDFCFSIFKKAKKKKEIRSDLDCRQLADVCVAMVDGLVFDALENDDAQLPARCELAVDLLFRSMKG